MKGQGWSLGENFGFLEFLFLLFPPVMNTITGRNRLNFGEFGRFNLFIAQFPD